MGDDSKFKQLCIGYKTTRDNFFRYRDRCVDFLEAVGAQMVRDWEIPNPVYVPLDEKMKPNTKYSALGATHFDFETGLFHMGIGFSVFMNNPNTFPQDHVVVRLSARIDGSEFLLSVYGGPLRSVGNGDTDRILPILDELFQKLAADYEPDPQKVRHSTDRPDRRQIGFVNEKGDDAE
jgi:hypothetical protein